jgi:truncated hemoglobin YjbI
MCKSSTCTCNTSTADAQVECPKAADNDPPHYQPKHGMMSKHIQTQFLQKQIDLGHMENSCLQDEKILSLQASKNADDPLFFWQICSLSGRDPIRKVVRNFYDRVFDDNEAPWFRDVFVRQETKRYHILMQTCMYWDCFGGGRLYGGGEKRVMVHHRKTMVEEIMTERGAERWIMHMVNALEEETPDLDQIDPRLRIALNTFLFFFMDKYSQQFGFSSEKVDFGETYPATGTFSGK